MTVKKQHKEERKTNLKDLAEALEKTDKGTKASHIRRIKNLERQREHTGEYKQLQNPSTTWEPLFGKKPR